MSLTNHAMKDKIKNAAEEEEIEIASPKERELQVIKQRIGELREEKEFTLDNDQLPNEWQGKYTYGKEKRWKKDGTWKPEGRIMAAVLLEHRVRNAADNANIQVNNNIIQAVQEATNPEITDDVTNNQPGREAEATINNGITDNKCIHNSEKMEIVVHIQFSYGLMVFVILHALVLSEGLKSLCCNKLK